MDRWVEVSVVASLKQKNKKDELSIYTRIFRVRSSCATMEAVQAVGVFQRRLRNPVDPFKTRKIMLTLQDIETLVHMPVKRAALSLGISSTTLKKTCRLLGMPRWPYSRRGTSYSKSSSERSNNEVPLTCESIYPLWDSELWDPHADTHPLCLDSGPCQDTDEVSDEGCDLWFLACECSPRCGPL